MAATYNITVNQNADFIRSFQVKENNVILDITGFTFEGRLKEAFHHTGHTSFTASIVDAATGTFKLVLTDVQTTAMPGGTYVYDVIMTTAAGVKTRLLSGNAFIIQGVTP
jgi:hypothetical protein